MNATYDSENVINPTVANSQSNKAKDEGSNWNT